MMLPRKAKGRRPVYTGDINTDKLYAMVMTLASETSVLRERLDTVERLLAAKGQVSSHDIETYVLDEAAHAQREAWRAEFLNRLLRIIEDDIADLKSGVTQESSQATVREIEGNES